MIRRQITKQELQNEPHMAWNSFIDILAMEAFEDLNETQRPAQLVFWYDSEVNNGGHLQYFLNSAGERAIETAETLLEVGLCSPALDSKRGFGSRQLRTAFQH